MTKYYRVKQDTFLWNAGAILKEDTKLNPFSGYRPIEDIWNTVPTTSEYISGPIIESPLNSIYFERVYSSDISGTVFKTKDQLVELYAKAFKV